jgi:hypothetical protein
LKINGLIQYTWAGWKGMRVRIYLEKRVDFPHDAKKPTVKLGIEIVELEASVIA